MNKLFNNNNLRKGYISLQGAGIRIWAFFTSTPNRD
jgi:hypothetical protein